MKITTLVENRSKRENLIEQYGLSMLVSVGEKNILVDAGQDETALANFLTLGLDISSIDAVFISHNHFDHIGGINAFLDRIRDDAPIYASSKYDENELFSKKLFRKKSLASRNGDLKKYEGRLERVSDKVEIFNGAYACTIKSPDPDLVCKDKKLKMALPNGKLVPDTFEHEIYLAVIENGKLKVISSCSHNGIVNIINDAKERFNMPVSVFVGGLHTRGSSSRKLNCSRKYLNEIIERLNESELEAIYTCHCTGIGAYKIFKEGLSFKIKYFSTGDVLNV